MSQRETQTHKRRFHRGTLQKRGVQLQKCDVAQLTRVGHKLKGAAEIPVTGRCAGAHVKHIGREGGETLDVSVPGRRFYDSVASLILVLREKTEGG